GVARCHASRLDCKRRGGGCERAPERFREGGGLRIEEQRDPLKARRKLLEQGQPFATMSFSKAVKPVMLPLGLARVGTTPLPTGSAIPTNTVGIGGIACRNNRAPCVAPVTIRSGERPISSCEYALSRAGSAPAPRSSVPRLRPSAQPNA